MVDHQLLKPFVAKSSRNVRIVWKNSVMADEWYGGSWDNEN